MRLGAMAMGLAAVFVPGCDGLELGFGRGAGAFCEGDATCDEGLFCDPADQRCKPLEPLGAVCTSNNQCDSGRCVGGVCCDGPCNSECLSCSLPGAAGRCSVVPEGDDPHDHCAGTAQCGAFGRCQGSVAWVHAMGDFEDQSARAAAILPVGAGEGVVVAGTFAGDMILGGAALSASAGSPDLFVAVFDSEGKLAWVKTFASEGDVAVAGVAAAPNGGIFVAGNHRGTLALGPSPLISDDDDAFIIALGAGGELEWLEVIGGPDAQALAGIAASEARVVAVGRHRGPLSINGFVSEGSASLDGFVVAFDLGGATASFASYGDESDQGAVAVGSFQGTEAVVALAGKGTVDFGAGSLGGASEDSDGFLAKLDFAIGLPSVVWDLRIGGPGDQIVTGLAVDAAGDAWIAATTTGPVPGLGVQHLEGIDGFVLRLDRLSGAPSGVRSLLGPFDDIPRAIAVAASGEVVVGGSFEVSVSLGGDGILEAVGAEDAFVMVLDPAGGLSWAAPYGGPLREVVRAVAFGGLGEVYAVGDFEHSMKLGSELLEARGERDAFITKLSR